ncbi:hypothetical protein ABLO27_11315 [Roseibium sp. SCPC15]|uniref:hypothetical protein n=1 Tax=Roseibium sp. SCP15 TaxID=3141376 RepID=UPI00333B82E1
MSSDKKTLEDHEITKTEESPPLVDVPDIDRIKKYIEGSIAKSNESADIPITILKDIVITLDRLARSERLTPIQTAGVDVKYDYDSNDGNPSNKVVQ